MVQKYIGHKFCGYKIHIIGKLKSHCSYKVLQVGILNLFLGGWEK